MNTIEAPRRPVPYECETGNAIIIPRGAKAKTKGILLGCFVPVLWYRNGIVIGHFGPRKFDTARERMWALCPDTPPVRVCIFRDSLARDSGWHNRAEEYLELFGHMQSAIAVIARVGTEAVETLKYQPFSDVIVSWPESADPLIYSRSHSEDSF